MAQNMGTIPKFDPRIIFNFKSLDKDTRSHLKNVYSCLVVEVIFVALGSALNCYLKSSILHYGGMIGVFGALLTLTVSSHTMRTLHRFGIACALAFCAGLESSYLIDFVVKINPSILVTAFVSTCVVFVSFSLSALYAERRSMLFLGSILTTALSSLLLIGIANIFFRIPSVVMFSIYASLIVSCLFVMYDTQLIVEKKRLGDRDFIWHSVGLFIDFITIFKDLCLILSSKEKQKKKE